MVRARSARQGLIAGLLIGPCGPNRRPAGSDCPEQQPTGAARPARTASYPRPADAAGPAVTDQAGCTAVTTGLIHPAGSAVATVAEQQPAGPTVLPGVR